MSHSIFEFSIDKSYNNFIIISELFFLLIRNNLTLGGDCLE